MWKVIVTLPAMLLATSVAEAMQDALAKPRFFDQKAVDFWGNGSPARTGPAAPSESIWAEPIRLPDGRTTTYLPPRPVLEFLENPTRENARKYLDWQAERMERMRKAAALLAELQREKSPKPREGDIVSGAPVTLTYFKKAG
jgi:hypothetical protein